VLLSHHDWPVVTVFAGDGNETPPRCSAVFGEKSSSVRRRQHTTRQEDAHRPRGLLISAQSLSPIASSYESLSLRCLLLMLLAF